MPAARAHHQSVRKSVTASSIRVGSGSFAFRLLKKTLNFGSTNVASTVTVTIAITKMPAG